MHTYYNKKNGNISDNKKNFFLLLFNDDFLWNKIKVLIIANVANLINLRNIYIYIKERKKLILLSLTK